MDLDSWTDEQLQSMLRWGNARANKCVFASAVVKLALTAEGTGRPSWLGGMYHQKRTTSVLCKARLALTWPSKMENFIRTKYESKRWVMDGGIPDPSTLDAEGDDDVVS